VNPNLLLIFFGAGFGGVSRYLVSTFVYTFLNRYFPFGTLVVNVSGCLLMGFLFTVLLNRFNESATALRALLLIGFLGGYTTFSSFSVETISLAENGAWLQAILNILLSVMLCLSASWLGIILGRHL